MNNNINFFAETSFRASKKKFGIKLDDRRRHMYVIGKTGMGKTVLLENMAIQDIRKGNGVGFIDPHGEAAQRLLDFIPSSRVNDVVYINPADIEYPIAFNVMEKVREESRHLIASGLMGVFKKIWPDVWSARMEYILYNTILALLENQNSTLLGINRMLADVEYRKKVVEKVTDPLIKSFWLNEFARYTQRYEVEATAAIQNKVGQFISAPLIRNIIGQVKSTISMRDIMDEGKILICDLSKGRIGEDNMTLLGGLLLAKLQLAAMSRVDIPEEERRDFFLYVDEFQNFATESFVNILSEARKYRLSLILAHQYIAQLDETVGDAVFGNVGTLVSFRVGAEDAEFLEREFTPEFLATDLVNLAKYNIYLRLMIDGLAGKPFSALTLPPFEELEKSNREKITRISRERYGTKREIVEKKIKRWTGFLETVSYEEPTTLYDAVCSNCKKSIKVPFKPDPEKPVYCKSCLKKIERKNSPANRNGEEKETKNNRPAKKKISLKEAVEKGPVPFISSNTKENRESPANDKKTPNLKKLREVLKEVRKGK